MNLRLFEMLKRRMGSERVIAAPVDEVRKSNPKIEELLDEREKLEGIDDLKANIDLIFEKYEGVRVDFYVTFPGDYSKDEKALRIINSVFEEYVKLEFPYSEESRDCSLTKLEAELEEGDSKRMTHDGSNWRMSISPIGDETENITGFIIMFYHNKDNYPRKVLQDHPIQHQLRYRLALNRVEEVLVQENVEYEIVTR